MNSLIIFQQSCFQKDITLLLHNSDLIHKVKKAILTKFLWIICLYELELSNSRTQNIQFATTSYVPTMYLQNDKDRFSNWLCWLLYHMRIPITGRSHELLQLRMGCFTGRKKSHFILHVPCFRLFSPSPVATDKTVGTGWDWIALSQTLAKIEENPYHLNKLKPNPRAPEYRLSIGSTIQN